MKVGSALIEVLKPYRWRFIAALILQGIAGVFSVLPWVLLSMWAQRLSRYPNEQGMEEPFLVIACVAAWLLSQSVATHWTHRIDVDVCHDLRQRLVMHLGRLPLDWFSRAGPDGVARLVGQDIRALHQFIAHTPLDVSNLFVVPLMVALWLMWREPALLLWCLVPLLLGAGTYGLLQSRVFRDEVRQRNSAMERLAQDYGEYAHNLMLARQYPGAGLQQRVQDSATDFESAFGRWVRRVGRLAASIQVQLGSAWLTAWVIAGVLLHFEQIPLAIGTVCAFILLLRVMCAPILALGHGSDALLSARDAAQRVQAVLELPVLSQGQSTLLPADGSLRVEGLSFCYEGKQVLRNVDLNIASSSLTALVGPSGSGKSSMLHLLARHMDPQSGRIVIGGIELRELPDVAWHAHVILVSQQAGALEMSIAQNLSLLRGDAQLSALRDVAKEVCLDDRVMARPLGYDSVVGVDVVLSGGELQRLALARALLSRAPVLLLDEPTSACDPDTAAALHRTLRHRAVSRTRLIVSHRLVEICDADQILVLDKGEVVEQGNHQELMAADRLYARMWHEQQGWPT